MTRPQIHTPAFLQLDIPGSRTSPSIEIKAIWQPYERRYTAGQVTFEHPAVPITSTRLRKARLHTTMATALRTQLSEANPELLKRAPAKTFFKGTVGRTAGAKVAADPTDEHLVNAALVFNLAKAVGEPAVRSVERCMGLDYSTARRWVTIARKNGFLDG